MSEDGTGVGFGRHLGFTVEHASPDALHGRVTITPAHHQAYGIVHGGVHCAVVEHAASVAAATWFGERGRVVGVSNSTNFVRAVRSGVLDVAATPLQRGRTQQLWQVAITDETGRLVAQGQVRLANLPADPAGPTTPTGTAEPTS